MNRIHCLTNEERFWRYVDKTSSPNGCWLWTGGTSGGYGCFGLRVGDKFKTVSAHRYAHELVKGPIPDDLYGLHSCNCTRCVNPDHVGPGTQYQNMKFASESGRSRIKWLDEATVAQIKALLLQGIGGSAVARMFNVTPACITNIRHGKAHKEVQPAELTQNKSATSSSKEQSRAS